MYIYIFIYSAIVIDETEENEHTRHVCNNNSVVDE